MPTMLPYLPVQSQPAPRSAWRPVHGIRGEHRRLSWLAIPRGGRVPSLVALAMVFGLGACRGDRYTDWSAERPRVERTEPWSSWSLPEGRTVSSDAEGLVVRYGHHGLQSSATPPDVAGLDAAWRDALGKAGFQVVRDQSRADRVSATFEEPGADGTISGSDGDGRQVAYAISSQAVRVGTRREKRRGEAGTETSVTVSLQILPEHGRVPLPPAE